MKLAGVIFLIIASASYAESTVVDDQASVLEQKISSIELRTAKLASSREHFLKGFAGLPPNLSVMACKAYPVKSESETIDILKHDISEVSDEHSYPKLSQEQASRVSAQREFVEKWKIGVDCSTMK